MKITVDVRLEAPELAESLRRLADAMPQIPSPESCRAVDRAAPKPPEESTQSPPASQEEQPEPQVTLEQVRAKLAALSQAGKQDQVRELISEFGGKRLSDISVDKYPDLLAKAEELA